MKKKKVNDGFFFLTIFRFSLISNRANSGVNFSHHRKEGKKFTNSGQESHPEQGEIFFNQSGISIGFTNGRTLVARLSFPVARKSEQCCSRGRAVNPPRSGDRSLPSCLIPWERPPSSLIDRKISTSTEIKLRHKIHQRNSHFLARFTM